MNQANDELSNRESSPGNRAGGFLNDELERTLATNSAWRFSCVFLSTSAKDAARLTDHLAVAGIRAYHAHTLGESELLLAITNATILLIDIDQTFELWDEILQGLEMSHPCVPQVVLTGQSEKIGPLIHSDFALEVIPKSAHLGDLLEALERAHSVERDINDPPRISARIKRVMAAVASDSRPQKANHLRSMIARPATSSPCTTRHSIRVRASAMMGRAGYGWYNSLCHRIRRQCSDA